ncbi:hypothetical protein CRYUN_Cryun02cG0073100 [Craigia yunnanensis]
MDPSAVGNDCNNNNCIDNLIAAKKSLKLSLEKSKALGLAFEKTVPRLEEINRRLPSLESAVRPIRADKDALATVGDHINRAVGPAAAVLKVFDAVHGLEKSLLPDPRNDLPGYLLVLKRLEEALRLLLMENSVPLPMSSPSLGEQACIAPSPLPVTVIQKLQAILGRLFANNRLEKCIMIYIEVRSSNVRASSQALDLDYLEISVAEFNDVQSIEGYIGQWGKHLEFAVKHLLEAEFKLCNDVFERIRLDVLMGCFAKIAAQAGILTFLQFGKTVIESKKDPIKLLKLLDIFASLNKLRLDFNRLFGGAACIEIQNLTRDLIRRVIDGAAETFWELVVQVELQRQCPPPQDGSVPRLVSLITDYCNKLLGDDYKPILTQVLVIHRSWKHEKFQERILVNEGTNLGELMGDSLLREHERYNEYYSTVFLRESWGKLPGHLSREGLILFSGGRATARDLVKKRLKTFNEAFDEVHKKQSGWLISEGDLREKTCQLIVQTVLPSYRSYMQNYGPLVEQDASSSKYTVQGLEQMLLSLFLPGLERYGSFNGRPTSSKFYNGVDLRRTASAVV